MQSTNVLYKQFEAMLNQKTWKMLRKYHIRKESFDEIKSFCNERFCIACQTYDPKKSAFSTHLTFCLMRVDRMTQEQFFSHLCEEFQDNIYTQTESISKIYEEAEANLTYMQTKMLSFIERITQDTRIIIKQACRDIPHLFNSVTGTPYSQSKQLWQDVRQWFNSVEHVA